MWHRAGAHGLDADPRAERLYPPKAKRSEDGGLLARSRVAGRDVWLAEGAVSGIFIHPLRALRQLDLMSGGARRWRALLSRRPRRPRRRPAALPARPVVVEGVREGAEGGGLCGAEGERVGGIWCEVSESVGVGQGEGGVSGGGKGERSPRRHSAKPPMRHITCRRQL